MSWTTNAIRRHLTGGQCETFEQCLARHRHGQPPPSVTVADRVAQLEDDLARAVLLIHTLVEACIERGVFSREEIAAVAEQVDLFDGVADGKLDPSAVRQRAAQSPPPAGEC